MELFVLILTGITAAIYMGRGLQKLFPPQPKRWKRLALYCLLEFTFTLPCWVGDENPILMLPFFILGFLTLVTGEKLLRLVCACMLYTLFISLNMLIDSLYWGNFLILIMMLVKLLLWCALAYFLVRIKPKDGLRLSRRMCLLLGGLTLAPLIAMLSFSIWGNTFRTEAQYQFYRGILQRFGFTILPFTLISALALLIAMMVLSRHEKLEQENKLAALRELYYTGLKREQIQLRTLRHDLHNHITALQGLIEQGMYTETAQYLAQMSDSPALDSSKRYTENETANVVLCSKAAQMALKGVVPDFEILLPRELAIAPPELCALLGNALDNAIEGVADAKNKIVRLRARLDKGIFMLQVQNEVGSTIHADLSTTKVDTSRHGFGISGMREIAAQYGGSLEAGIKNGCFELLVCFPVG